MLISASLFVALQGEAKTMTATSVYTTTTTMTLTSMAPQSLPTIVVGGTTFTYTQWNSSTPNSFAISGVKFALWTNTTVTYTGGSCYGAGGYGGYVITFPGGSSETMTTCTVGVNPPTVVRLSNHVDPQAGLLIYPSTGAVYFLVSSPPSRGTNTISLSGFSIATTGVVQPTPYLSGDIYVSAASGVTWSITLTLTSLTRHTTQLHPLHERHRLRNTTVRDIDHAEQLRVFLPGGALRSDHGGEHVPDYVHGHVHGRHQRDGERICAGELAESA